MTRKMKDSGVEWIGDIPEEWEVVPNKRIMKKVKNICEIYKDEKVLSLTMNGVIVRDLENPSGKMPLTFDGYQYVEKNNLLMCLFDIDVTPRCIGIIENNGITSPAYSQFELTNDADIKYYYYYYLNLDYTKELLHLAKNLRHSLTEGQLGEVYVPMPSKEEQTQIASYLDKKCNKIDQTIEKEKQVIEKLKEYKQSVITEAVTKGLNPDVKMKDSGVEWIGEIPEHWQVVKLKQVFSFRKGLSITKDNLVEKGVKVISYGQIHSKNNNGVSIDDSLIRYVGNEYLEMGKQSLVLKNDFIFADTSEDLEGAGNCVFVDSDEEIFAGYHTIILAPIKRESIPNWRYFAYLYKTDCWRSQIRSRVSGIKLFSITQKILKQAEVIMPDINEQQKIIDYLDNKCSSIDKLISNKEKVIDKLTEYKKSLIYECVTGKREVQ